MPPSRIASPGALAALYPNPVAPASITKEIDRIDGNYAALIAASPFCVIATSGPGGLDCSPRGDEPGFVVVEDERTLLIPDRRGNNRLDTLRNLLADDRIGLLFMIPGVGETLRVNGRAAISAEPGLLARFAVDGKEPASVLVVAVERVYFQCSRAIVRAQLWDGSRQAAKGAVPSPGTMLRDIASRNAEAFDGEAYDEALPERVRATLY